MRKTMLLIQLLCVLFSFTGCGKSKDVTPVKEEEQPADNDDDDEDFKVIGYLFANGRLAAEMEKIDFAKITHLNIAFLNPDAAGVFTSADDLTAVVKKAHDHDVKILFSIGGGNPPAHLKPLLNADKRAMLIQNMVNVLTTYNFDGIDVDLENDFIDGNYEPFVTELGAILKPMKKLMTTAVVTWTSAKISDKALSQFDFINIMSYDHTGPWDKTRPGQHSSYAETEKDIQHWNKVRGIAASRLTLGLPFYGYGFGTDIVESMSYKDIVATYPGAENDDSVTLPGGTMYYNGIPTIQKKVKLAHSKKLGGVMIWELKQDAPGSKSLLTAISNVTP